MSTERNRIQDSTAEALERSAEPLSREARTALRSRVMGAVRRDARAHYFASISHRVAATLAAFAVLGSGVAYAANSTLPGEPLYALKRGAEDALVALLPPGALEQRVLLGFAERRAGEAADLAIGGAGAGLVDDAIQQVRTAVQEAAANGEALTEREARQIQQQAQDAPEQTREAIHEAVADPTPPPTGADSGPAEPGDDGKSPDTPPGNPDPPGNSGETTGGSGPH